MTAAYYVIWIIYDCYREFDYLGILCVAGLGLICIEIFWTMLMSQSSIFT